MLVPLARSYSPKAVDNVSTPGAVMSTPRLKVEKSARTSDPSTAPTETTPCSAAGYSMSGVPVLPEAATVRMPAERAALNVGWTSATCSGSRSPPSDMLMMSAPCVRAQSTASSRSAEAPEAELVEDLDGHQGARRCDTRDPLAVVGLGEDRAGHVGAVPGIVGDVRVVPDLIAWIDDVDAHEVGMREVDAAVDDRDDDVGITRRGRPALGNVDLVEVVLVAEARIVRWVGGPIGRLDLRVWDDREHARVVAQGSSHRTGLARVRCHDHALARRRASRTPDTGDAEFRGRMVPPDDDEPPAGRGDVAGAHVRRSGNGRNEGGKGEDGRKHDRHRAAEA